MKNIKKLLIAGASLALLASCEIPNIVIGGHNQVNGDNSQQTADATFKTPSVDYLVWQDKSYTEYCAEDVSNKEVWYQFIKMNAELSGRLYDVMINLYDDGLVTIRQYYHPDGTEPYWTTYWGYWANLTENLYFGTVCHAMNTSGSVVYGISYSYNLTVSDGTFTPFAVSLAMGFAEGGQYVRSVEFSGTGSVEYPTYKSFEDSLGLTCEDPKYIPSDIF